METLPIFHDLGIALLLGLLVGIQRQHADAPLGGVRTFPLITVFGSVCAMLADKQGGWIVAAGLIGVIAIIVVGKRTSDSRSDGHAGLTTAAALLLMFSVGAYIPAGNWSVAIAVGGAVAILLQMKLELHGLVARLSDTDIKAIMQFVLITFIILPVLPDRTFGWYDVLNPHEAWLMVVLVVGISLSGYIVWKFFGQQAGIVIGGMLGGTISSTATTVSFAKRSRRVAAAAPPAVTVIMIATAVSFVRVVVEIAVVSREFLLQAMFPMMVMVVAAVVLCVVAWFFTRNTKETMPEQGNPTELKSAVLFGLLYALVLFGVAATREHFQQSGLFVVAVLSGLTDMDAITLSTSRLVSADRLTPQIGWRIIVTAAMANLVFKAGIVAMLGHRRLLLRTVILFGILITIGGTLMAVLP